MSGKQLLADLKKACELVAGLGSYGDSEVCFTSLIASLRQMKKNESDEAEAHLSEAVDMLTQEYEQVRSLKSTIASFKKDISYHHAVLIFHLFI